jgi:hypothetical protein
MLAVDSRVPGDTSLLPLERVNRFVGESSVKEDAIFRFGGIGNGVKNLNVNNRDAVTGFLSRPVTITRFVTLLQSWDSLGR